MGLLRKVLSKENGENCNAQLVEQMVESGRQVPLKALLTYKEIQRLTFKEHALARFKKRFRRLHDIEIENMIKKDLMSSSMIVEKGHSGRWKVHCKGMILVLDKESVYTTYDANGQDSNNELDETKVQLQKVRKKTRGQDKIERLIVTLNEKQALTI